MKPLSITLMLLVSVMFCGCGGQRVIGIGEITELADTNVFSVQLKERASCIWYIDFVHHFEGEGSGILAEISVKNSNLFDLLVVTGGIYGESIRIAPDKSVQLFKGDLDSYLSYRNAGVVNRSGEEMLFDIIVRLNGADIKLKAPFEVLLKCNRPSL